MKIDFQNPIFRFSRNMTVHLCVKIWSIINKKNNIKKVIFLKIFRKFRHRNFDFCIGMTLAQFQSTFGFFVQNENYFQKTGGDSGDIWKLFPDFFQILQFCGMTQGILGNYFQKTGGDSGDI